MALKDKYIDRPSKLGGKFKVRTYDYGDVKEAVLELINEIDNIKSDDFEHDCHPHYEDVLDLILEKVKRIFGDFEEEKENERRR